MDAKVRNGETTSDRPSPMSTSPDCCSGTGRKPLLWWGVTHCCCLSLFTPPPEGARSFLLVSQPASKHDEVHLQNRHLKTEKERTKASCRTTPHCSSWRPKGRGWGGGSRKVFAKCCQLHQGRALSLLPQNIATHKKTPFPPEAANDCLN